MLLRVDAEGVGTCGIGHGDVFECSILVPESTADGAGSGVVPNDNAAVVDVDGEGVRGGFRVVEAAVSSVLPNEAMGAAGILVVTGNCAVVVNGLGYG